MYGNGPFFGRAATFGSPIKSQKWIGQAANGSIIRIVGAGPARWTIYVTGSGRPGWAYFYGPGL